MLRKWVLEGYFGTGDSQLQRIPITGSPMPVGRDSHTAIAIGRCEVSRNHAEFLSVNGELILRDLGSTNGTFVNDKPLHGETIIRHGDVVHFATFEVRVIEDVCSSQIDDPSMTIISRAPRINTLPAGLSELQLLLDQRAIKSRFQPIVKLDGSLYGYEVLGRGSLSKLPTSPMELFRIAESLPGKDAELSLLMRDCGVEQACEQSSVNRLFVNTHPTEMKNVESLLGTMSSLRSQCPDVPMVLEIHENAVADMEMLKRFAASLHSLNIELAYDDFGAGQARLMEMIEVPVKYVKFDMSLIRGLHKATEAKQNMVSTLVKMTRDMGIQALAEGVELHEEYQLCRQMDFDLIQGYFFGKPQSLLSYNNRFSATH